MVIEVFIEARGMSSNSAPHVADMRNRDADLADLAARQRVVAVIAGLSRQIEGDRQAGLALGEILAVEPVGLAGGRVAGIGAEDPGLVPGRRKRIFTFRLGHNSPAARK